MEVWIWDTDGDCKPRKLLPLRPRFNGEFHDRGLWLLPKLREPASQAQRHQNFQRNLERYQELWISPASSRRQPIDVSPHRPIQAPSSHLVLRQRGVKQEPNSLAGLWRHADERAAAAGKSWRICPLWRPRARREEFADLRYWSQPWFEILKSERY